MNSSEAGLQLPIFPLRISQSIGEPPPYTDPKAPIQRDSVIPALSDSFSLQHTYHSVVHTSVVPQHTYHYIMCFQIGSPPKLSIVLFIEIQYVNCLSSYATIRNIYEAPSYEWSFSVLLHRGFVVAAIAYIYFHRPAIAYRPVTIFPHPGSTS